MCIRDSATVMIKKECLLNVGGYSASRECRRAEDYDLFMRLYASGYQGYNLPDILYQYYVNVDLMRKKRRYRYRVDEAIVRWNNFKRLELIPKGLPYVLKPLIVGLMPVSYTHLISKFIIYGKEVFEI